MALTGISLNAATTVGVGSTISFDTPRSDIAMQVTYTGSPASIDVALEGTIDGSTFFALTDPSGFDSGQIFTPSTKMAVIAVRAHLKTLSGGTSPTVTASIAAVD